MAKGEFKSKVAKKNTVVVINDRFRYVIHDDGNNNHELQEFVSCKQKDGTVVKKFTHRGWFGGIRDIARRFVDRNAEYMMSCEEIVSLKDILKFYKDSEKIIIKHIDGLK